MSANRFMSGTSANGQGATRAPHAESPRERVISIAVSVIVRAIMTISVTTVDAGFRDALRLFQHDAAALRDLGPSLETTVTPPEPPRVIQSDVIESTTVRAHRIVDPPIVGFDAFLDGAQESKVVHYADGVPIVFGRVAAVVRQRVLRRMVTWKRPIYTGRASTFRATSCRRRSGCGSSIGDSIRWTRPTQATTAGWASRIRTRSRSRSVRSMP